MGIKYIHVTLIVVSIALALGFGLWALMHNAPVSGYVSLGLMCGLIYYCVQFIKKMKAL